MNELLHKKALEVAKEYRKAEWQMIEVLQEIDKEKLYYYYDCKSLFQYCLKYLKISEAVAYGLIRIARKAEQVPELKEKIKSGEIATTKAVKICSLLKAQKPTQNSVYAKPKDLSFKECSENKSYNQNWLKKAEMLSSKELEKEIIKEKPKDYSLKESKRLLSEDHHSLHLKLSQEEMEILEKLKDISKTESLGEAILKAAKDYLKRKDPMQKKSKTVLKNSGARNISNAAKREKYQITKEILRAKKKRQKISEATKTALYHKHKGQCSDCGVRNNLQIHHIKPLSLGGTNELENLSLICSSCHKKHHFLEQNARLLEL